MTPAVAVRPGTFRSLRRHRNYRLYFSGQIVSLAGTWMQNVALTWLVLELSRSPIAIGLLVFARFLPYTLLGLVAGVLVDRFDCRKVLIWSQAGAMAVSCALVAMVYTGTSSLPLVYVLAGVGGLMLVLEAPSRNALTFEMVGPGELPNAVALNSGLLNASRVVGPAIAGVLIGIGGVGPCFVINTASFLAVLGALAAMRADELHPVAKDPSASLLSGTWEGLRFALADPDLRAILLVIVGIALFGLNFNTLVPLLASDALHVGGEAFGALSATFGLGAVAGALASARSRTASWEAFVAGSLGFSLLLLVLAWTSSVVGAGVLLFGLGTCFTLLTANGNTLLQLAAPDRLRGRVVSLYLYAFIGLTPFGGLLAGWLAERGGTPLAFSIAGGSGIASVALATVVRRPKE